MTCRKCGERLKVTRTKSKAGRVTVRYYSCPGCGTRCSSTERLADIESTVDTPPGSVPGREAWERVPPDPYYPGADDEIKIEAGNVIELKGGAGNG